VSRVHAPTVEVEGIPWPVLGAQVAIIRNGRVLLQFRPWPPGWELPGGHCEDTESPEATATREAEEETGLVPVGEGLHLVLPTRQSKLVIAANMSVGLRTTKGR